MQPQIIGLGLTTIDVLVRLDGLPDWNSGGGELDEMTIDGGGPVGTALVTAARLGAATSYLGSCGNDELAALKLSLLARDRVDIGQVVIRHMPEAFLVLVCVHPQTGERTFLLPRAWKSQPDLRPEDLKRESIVAADILLLDGYHPQAALQAAQWMHAAGKTVVLDGIKTHGEPISEEVRTLVPLCDILICGSGFAPSLTGCTDRWEAALAAQRMGPGVVVQTEGSQGSDTLAGDERFHTPAFTVSKVIDTTGAGDVFHGAYLYGLLQSWDHRQIARFASAAAALKCTHLGGRRGIPHLKEINDFLDQNAAQA